MIELYWLPVRYRITYEINLLVLNPLITQHLISSPTCFSITHSHARCGYQETFWLPNSSLENIWGSCFCCSCSKTMNTLPLDLRLSNSFDIFTNPFKPTFLKWLLFIDITFHYILNFKLLIVYTYLYFYTFV